MADPRLEPGWLTQTGARGLRRFVRQAEQQRAMILDTARNDRRERIPAKLTGKSFDSTLGVWVYSWTERSYSAAGLRIDKPEGRTGTAAFRPAVAYGDGWPVGDGDFPVDVWLRRTLTTGTHGPVYEFPWYCACEAGASGSGAGIVTNCCPGYAVPTDLYMTISAPGCDCYDGAVVQLVYDSSVSAWVGAPPPCLSGDVFDRSTFRFICEGDWGLSFIDFSGATGPGYVCGWATGGQTKLDDGCEPVFGIFTGTIQQIAGDQACPCAGIETTFYITE